MELNPDSRHHSDARRAAEESSAAYFAAYSQLLEFKKLRDLAPRGIYVVPAAGAANVWHGVAFVRSGLWRGAIFRFVLSLPPPGAAERTLPTARFLTPVHHPRVCFCCACVRRKGPLTRAAGLARVRLGVPSTPRGDGATNKC